MAVLSTSGAAAAGLGVRFADGRIRLGTAAGLARASFGGGSASAGGVSGCRLIGFEIGVEAAWPELVPAGGAAGAPRADGVLQEQLSQCDPT
eukprot:2142233-Pyramimonas_sp.AAC.1